MASLSTLRFGFRFVSRCRRIHRCQRSKETPLVVQGRDETCAITFVPNTPFSDRDNIDSTPEGEFLQQFFTSNTIFHAAEEGFTRSTQVPGRGRPRHEPDRHPVVAVFSCHRRRKRICGSVMAEGSCPAGMVPGARVCAK